MEITIPGMSIPNKPDKEGNIAVTFKGDDTERTKKSKNKDEFKAAVNEVWGKAKSGDVDNIMVKFEKVIENPRTPADSTWFRWEALSTFVDIDEGFWLSQRAEGGYTYKASLWTRDGKWLKEFPPKFFNYEEDGEIFLDDQEKKENKRQKGRDREFVPPIISGGNDIDPQEMLRSVTETITRAIKQGIEIATPREGSGDGGKDMVSAMIEVAKVMKGSEQKQDNSGIITALITALPVILQAIKPAEKDDTKFYAMMIEMQKNNNDNINRLGEMIVKSNEEINRSKQEMVALINQKNSPGVNVAEILNPVIEASKLSNVIQAQAFTGLASMFKTMMDFKDMNKQQDEDVEERPVATVLLDGAVKLLQSGTEFFKTMRPGTQQQSPPQYQTPQKPYSEPENSRQRSEVDINDIIEKIAAEIDKACPPHEIAVEILHTYEGEKQELIDILNQDQQQLLGMISPENMAAVEKHYVVMGQVLEEIKKGLSNA